MSTQGVTTYNQPVVLFHFSFRFYRVWVIFLAWTVVSVLRPVQGQRQPAAERIQASGQDRILLVLPFDNRTGQPNLEWIREAAPAILGARLIRRVLKR